MSTLKTNPEHAAIAALLESLNIAGTISGEGKRTETGADRPWEYDKWQYTITRAGKPGELSGEYKTGLGLRKTDARTERRIRAEHAGETGSGSRQYMMRRIQEAAKPTAPTLDAILYSLIPTAAKRLTYTWRASKRKWTCGRCSHPPNAKHCVKRFKIIEKADHENRNYC